MPQMDLQPNKLSDLFHRMAKWNLETRDKCIHTYVASQTFGTISQRDGGYYIVYVEQCTQCGKEKIVNTTKRIRISAEWLSRQQLPYTKPLADESSFFNDMPDKAYFLLVQEMH